MLHVNFNGITGEIISSSPKKGWSVCKTGISSYTLIYKKPSIIERILDFISLS